MTKCLHTISRCHATTELSHGHLCHGGKQSRECRADTLSTELSQHRQFLQWQWCIKQQGCGFVSEAKARIGGSVSAPRCQARSGAGRMLAAQCGHSHRTQYSKTWGMLRNISVQWNTWHMYREVFIVICPSVAYKVFTFMFVWGWLCQLKYVHYISDSKWATDISHSVVAMKWLFAIIWGLLVCVETFY